MSELVVNGLVRKRAELAGEIEHTQARLKALLLDVGSLDSAIRVFDPEYKVEGIKAKRYQVAERTGRGEVSRGILSILRQAAEPMTTRSVAMQVIRERGRDADDQQLLRLTVKRVGLALHRQCHRGSLRQQARPGQEMVWEVVR